MNGTGSGGRRCCCGSTEPPLLDCETVAEVQAASLCWYNIEWHTIGLRAYFDCPGWISNVFFECTSTGGGVFTSTVTAIGITYNLELGFANAWDGIGQRIIDYVVITNTSNGEVAMVQRNGSNPNYDQRGDCCMRFVVLSNTPTWIADHITEYTVNVSVSNPGCPYLTGDDPCSTSGRIGTNAYVPGYYYDVQDRTFDCEHGVIGGPVYISNYEVRLRKSHGSNGPTNVLCNWYSNIEFWCDAPCTASNGCGCGWPRYCSVYAQAGWNSNGGYARAIAIDAGITFGGAAVLEESSPGAGDFTVSYYTGACDWSGTTISVSGPIP